MKRTNQISRHNYTRQRENIYSFEKPREYTSRRSIKYAKAKNKQLNTHMLKTAICFFAVLVTLIIANSNSNLTINVKKDIKTALSENISSQNIETTLTKFENIFTNKNDLNSKDTEYTDFRIDENIIKQMDTSK